MAILDIRDQVAATRDLVGCLYLACQHVQIEDERAALSTVSHAVREKLREIDAALERLIGGDTDGAWTRGGI